MMRRLGDIIASQILNDCSFLKPFDVANLPVSLFVLSRRAPEK